MKAEMAYQLISMALIWPSAKAEENNVKLKANGRNGVAVSIISAKRFITAWRSK
jgi:hypothetical protein